MNSKNINKKKLYLYDLIIFIVCVFLDRISKYFAVIKLKGHPSLPIISGILELRYLENYGAAFGLLQNQKIFFVFVAIIVFFTSLYIILRAPGKKKYVYINIFLVLIMSGAIGNMCDRFIYGYVIDFIYFSIINFPVFNIADIFVTVSTALFVLFLLFYYKEDDLNFLKFVEKKLRDVN